MSQKDLEKFINDSIPSIKQLEEILTCENRKLSTDDREICQKICLEFASKADLLKTDWFLKSIERTDTIHNRIKLYKSNKIEIRIHLFFDRKIDPFIHQHGQYFISTCLSGEYDHNLYDVKDSNDKYFVYIREENGIFNQEPSETRNGTLCVVSSQPFQAGQTFWISPFAFHTIQVKQSPLVTFVIRDAEDTVKKVEFLHLNSNLKRLPLKPQQIKDYETADLIRKQFIQALKIFSETLNKN